MTTRSTLSKKIWAALIGPEVGAGWSGLTRNIFSLGWEHLPASAWQGVPNVVVVDAEEHGCGTIGVPNVVVDDTCEHGDAAVAGDRGEYPSPG